jgi:hypothetical protein
VNEKGVRTFFLFLDKESVPEAKSAKDAMPQLLVTKKLEFEEIRQNRN